MRFHPAHLGLLRQVLRIRGGSSGGRSVPTDTPGSRAPVPGATAPSLPAWHVHFIHTRALRVLSSCVSSARSTCVCVRVRPHAPCCQDGGCWVFAAYGVAWSPESGSVSPAPAGGSQRFLRVPLPAWSAPSATLWVTRDCRDPPGGCPRAATSTERFPRPPARLPGTLSLDVSPFTRGTAALPPRT